MTQPEQPGTGGGNTNASPATDLNGGYQQPVPAPDDFGFRITQLEVQIGNLNELVSVLQAENAALNTQAQNRLNELEARAERAIAAVSILAKKGGESP